MAVLPLPKPQNPADSAPLARQFPLKPCGFPGAGTARKRFLLWKMMLRRKNRSVPAVYEAILPVLQIIKTGGFRRLENLKGFQPAAGGDENARGLRPSRNVDKVSRLAE